MLTRSPHSNNFNVWGEEFLRLFSSQPHFAPDPGSASATVTCMQTILHRMQPNSLQRCMGSPRWGLFLCSLSLLIESRKRLPATPACDVHVSICMMEHSLVWHPPTPHPYTPHPHPPTHTPPKKGGGVRDHFDLCLVRYSVMSGRECSAIIWSISPVWTTNSEICTLAQKHGGKANKKQPKI